MDRLWTPWRMEYLTSEKPADCVLCRSLTGEDVANHVVHRGAHSFIILNLYPYNNGHIMVVPNRHVASLELLSPDELLSLMQMVNLGLAALRNSMSPEGFNIGVNLGKAAGAGIDAHVHVHIVPRWQGDTNFMPILADTRVIPESLPDTRLRLARAVQAVLGANSEEEADIDEDRRV